MPSGLLGVESEDQFSEAAGPRGFQIDDCRLATDRGGKADRKRLGSSIAQGHDKFC